MAKSPTEQFRELSIQHELLMERDANRHREVQELKVILEKERDARITSDRENAILRQQLQDHLTQYQEWDRRRWGLIVMLIGAVMSLASGLIVTLVRK
jgi:hypothetical protein